MKLKIQIKFCCFDRQLCFLLPTKNLSQGTFVSWKNINNSPIGHSKISFNFSSAPPRQKSFFYSLLNSSVWVLRKSFFPNDYFYYSMSVVLFELHWCSNFYCSISTSRWFHTFQMKFWHTLISSAPHVIV